MGSSSGSCRLTWDRLFRGTLQSHYANSWGAQVDLLHSSLPIVMAFGHFVLRHDDSQSDVQRCRSLVTMCTLFATRSATATPCKASFSCQLLPPCLLRFQENRYSKYHMCKFDRKTQVQLFNMDPGVDPTPVFFNTATANVSQITVRPSCETILGSRCLKS